ncbi:MAG: Fur family transcriptional regulator [Flavobacteriales bacterium]|jgi:Fur family ferric uptake transcriptional regulator|nr:Fur family transcriptional regulator [Flavobacteriales bacterium]
MGIREQLRGKGFRVTALRTELLALLQRSDRALTRSEVEERLEVAADRATVFRALNAFEEAGLVHRVLDGAGTSCFAACADACGDGHHKDLHAHFHCRSCGSVFCLPSVELPKVKVPRGFRMEQSQLELQGICKACV